MATAEKQIPFFFKCFSADDRTQKLHLPQSWCSYMGRSLPSEAFFRNRYGDSWEVKVAHYQNTDRFWFEEGWRTFVEQNKLAYKDHIVFKYDGKSTFDFKLFDENDDEKEYVRIPKLEVEKYMELEQVVPEFEPEPEPESQERQNMHHSEPVEPEPEPPLEPESEERQLQLEPEEQRNMHPEPEQEERQNMQLQPEPEEMQVMQLERAPGLTPPESEYSASDGEDRSDEDFEFDDELEEGNTRSRRKTIGRKRAPPVNEDDEEAVFRSGFPRPNNPYFVTKRRCKRNELYVPTEVVKDFKLTFPEEIVIRDEKNGEWTARVRKWKDGRLWLSKGWKSYCKWNHVQRDDWCIIEIVRPETPEADIFLKTHLVPAAALAAARRS